MENSSPRRRFLQGAGAATGALLLQNVLAHADEPATGPELVLKLEGTGDLKKVGGFAIVDTKVGKIIVARTGEATFSACSAICPHKKCEVEYEHDAKQFVCPCHNSRFDLDGKVLKGPAKTDLKKYPTQPAVTVEI